MWTLARVKLFSGLLLVLPLFLFFFSLLHSSGTRRFLLSFFLLLSLHSRCLFGAGVWSRVVCLQADNDNGLTERSGLLVLEGIAGDVGISLPSVCLSVCACMHACIYLCAYVSMDVFSMCVCVFPLLRSVISKYGCMDIFSMSLCIDFPFSDLSFLQTYS